MAKQQDHPAADEGNPPVDENGRRYRPRKPAAKPEPKQAPENVAKPLQNSNPGRTDFPAALTVEPDEVDVQPPPPRRYYWCGLTPDAPMDEIRCGSAVFRKRGGIPLRDEVTGQWHAWLPTVGIVQCMSVDGVESTLWALGRTGFDALYDNTTGELIACNTTRLKPGMPCAAEFVWMVELGDEKPDPATLVNATPPPPLLARRETTAAAAAS